MADKSKQTSDISPLDFFQEESMSLADIMVKLARQIKLIFIIPTIICSLTIIYVQFFAIPVYTSTSKIMSSSSGGTSSQASGLALQFGINIPGIQSEPIWVYPEIMKSRTLARTVLKRKFDTNEFGKQKSLLQILTYGNDKPLYGVDTLEIKAVENFLEMIEISEDTKTAIFTLNINASEPNLASELNMALIQELDMHQRNYNKTKATDTKTFIEERIITTEKELMATEENLKVFRDRNRRIENSPSLQLEEQRLRREVTVLTGVFTTLKQQFETTKIEEYKDSDYVIVIDPPEVPLYPSSPKKRQSVILAGIIGIGFGVILGLFRESLNSNSKKEKNKMSEAKYLIFKNISDLIPGRLKS
tara:strand:- start:1056 stop:2138 length:1083 start_codon:yes stop_codon:yes gene_type:complete